MKRKISVLFCSLTLIKAVAQVEYVDPTIGGVGYLLEPTRPAVHLPNSMVRVYPVRKDQFDDQISSFPLTIISHRLGELFSLMPGDTDKPAAWDQEITTPYYYSTRFDDSLIRTEFTPSARCGFFRFTFPAGKASIWLGNRFPGQLRFAGQSISGEENFNGMKAYVYGVFNAPMTFFAAGDGPKKMVRALADATGLEFRYAISFISVDQARKNLEEGIPGWNFDQVKARAKALKQQVEATNNPATVKTNAPGTRPVR